MKSNEEEDYWYYNYAPTMMGAIMDLYAPEEEEPKRRFWHKKIQEEPEPVKPTFGFGRVLDDE